MNAFLEPLSRLNHWSRADINLVLAFAATFGALSAPLLSTLAERLGLRATMTMGAALGGASIFLLGWVDNIFLFGYLYVAAWICGQAFGGVVGNLLINRWFNIHQGRAFGLCAMGTSLSGAIMPFVLLLLIDSANMRTAWSLYGIVIMALAPVGWYMIRNSPEEMGLHRDNIPPRQQLNPHNASKPLPLSVILRMPALFYVGLTFGLTLMVGSSVMSQLKPRLVDVGFSSYTAMSFMCLAALCAGLAKYFWGWLCDKISPIIVTRIFVASTLGSLLLMFLPPSALIALAFAIIFGISVGGAWAVLPSAVAHVFGKEHFGSVYRIVPMFIVLKGMGFPILGFSFTRTGSYNAAYMIYIAALCLCLVFTFLLPVASPAKNLADNNVS